MWVRGGGQRFSGEDGVDDGMRTAGMAATSPHRSVVGAVMRVSGTAPGPSLRLSMSIAQHIVASALVLHITVAAALYVHIHVSRKPGYQTASAF